MGDKTVKLTQDELDVIEKYRSEKKNREAVESNKQTLQTEYDKLLTLLGTIQGIDPAYVPPWQASKSKTAPGTDKHKILVFLKDGTGRTLDEIKTATGLALTTKKQSHLFQLVKSKHLTLKDGKYTITEVGKTDADKT